MRRLKNVLRSPLGISASALLGVVLALAVLAPVLWSGKASAIDTNAILKGPSGAHWLGTNTLGQDVFFRVLVATRLSVELAVAATVIGVAAGLVLGAAPLVIGARLGRLVTAVVNIAVAFPALLLALFFAIIFGVGARGALLSFAGLSFLGLGVQAPSYDWGQLLNDGLDGIYEHPAAALAPGIAVVLAGLAFNLFGEALALGLGVPELAGGPLARAARAGRRAPAAGRLARAEKDSSALSGTDPADSVLVVRDLRVSFPGGVHPVRGVSFTLSRGEAVGVVGESGSGKTLTAHAVAQLLEDPARVTAGRLALLGQDLLAGSRRGTSRVRRQFLGTSLGMVFQDPMTSFNPVKRVGGQLAEVAREHQGMSRRDAAARATERLRAVRIPAPLRRYRQFPHELSGGMRQRAMIGMAVMGAPALVIADEPTTALDVTVQRQVLRLLKSIQSADDLALLFISHDITVVGQVCDRVLVMYAGRIVENLPAAELATHARHPYTKALLAAEPSMTTDKDAPLAVVPGRPADPGHLPAGCAFAPRCPLADEKCASADPELVTDDAGREVACWHAPRVPVTIANEIPVVTGNE